VKKALQIFIISYYLFGIFCLPIGDFSVLKNLPIMYQQCKATEDKDMTPLDFLTDHLVNIDSVFDNHANNDEQKPHTSKFLHQHSAFNLFHFTIFAFQIQQNEPIENEMFLPANKFHTSTHIFKIFRPPII